jgi:hypothetical protein
VIVWPLAVAFGAAGYSLARAARSRRRTEPAGVKA